MKHSKDYGLAGYMVKLATIAVIVLIIGLSSIEIVKNINPPKIEIVEVVFECEIAYVLSETLSYLKLRHQHQLRQATSTTLTIRRSATENSKRLEDMIMEIVRILEDMND